MSESNPYKTQPKKAFWRRTISNAHFLEINDWYVKKWPIANSRISTAGSCFAQHIGRYLRNSGFDFIDVEPPPRSLRQDRWLEYGYNMYSARYGNIYTPRQLLQLLQRAQGELRPKDIAWALDDGYVDPFRPTIEPVPLSSIEEVDALRDSHLAAVCRMFEKTDVFIFTLGLTEAWMSKEDGVVFPVCPGVKGGIFDDSKYCFINFSYPEIGSDIAEFIARARSINEKMRFIFTISPVPLAATATDQQVLVATTYSKSVLRAAAGVLADNYEFIDYFPSYEIISSHVMRGTFYESDLRSVVDCGVDHVMKQFFGQHIAPISNENRLNRSDAEHTNDVICDESILAKFGD